MDKDKIARDIYNACKYTDIPIIEENLRKLKNINKLGLNSEEILKGSLNESRFNLDFSKQFHFNPATIFVHDYTSLKRCAKYIFTIEKLLGKFFKRYPKYKSKRLKDIFVNNFADFGLLLSFIDFCDCRNIKITEFEPQNPLVKNKRLDLKILIDKREVLVECFSPIESIIKGVSLENKIKEEIERHSLKFSTIPLMLVINLTDPSWSGNAWNRGYISDEMFKPVKEVIKYEVWNPNKFHNISAILIKYGKIGHLHLNLSLQNPLTQKEIKILTSNPSFFDNLLRSFR